MERCTGSAWIFTSGSPATPAKDASGKVYAEGTLPPPTRFDLDAGKNAAALKVAQTLMPPQKKGIEDSRVTRVNELQMKQAQVCSPGKRILLPDSDQMSPVGMPGCGRQCHPGGLLAAGLANVVSSSLTLRTFRSNIPAFHRSEPKERELGQQQCRAEYTTYAAPETLSVKSIAGSVGAGRRGSRSRGVLSIPRK